MLKLFFWLLLTGNVALFATQSGYFSASTPERHEPQRQGEQLQPQALTILPPNSAKLIEPATATQAEPGNSASADAKTSAPPEPKVDTIACTEIGNFNGVEARKFDAQLAALNLKVKPTTASIQEIASHMVYIPSQESKDGADRKAAELRRLGIQDFYVIPDSQPNPALHWAISLGVFKTEEAAKAYIGQLIPRGVRSARIMARTLSTSKQAYQWHNIDASTKAVLDELKDKFPAQEMRNCADSG